MDITTYALLNKRLLNLAGYVEDRMAVLDAGLQSAASIKDGVETNEITESIWQGLNNDTLDVFCALDNVLIKANYTATQDYGVVIKDSQNNLICSITESDSEYVVTWGTGVTDADISVSEVGLIGNVHADWEESLNTNAAFIENKPAVFDGASNNCSVKMNLSTNVASGSCSFAHGDTTTASGTDSHAEGFQTTASGSYSHSEGYQTSATGARSHSEGNGTTASGGNSHSEGASTTASGGQSHSEGAFTTANGKYMHAQGLANVSANIYPAWVASTSYSVGSVVLYNNKNYICKTANSDATWDSSKWDMVKYDGDTAFVIGNGYDNSNKSNAMKVDWFGNQYLNGDVYVNCNADSSGGTMLPYDVQSNGISVVNNGVANIPKASSSAFGVIKAGGALKSGADVVGGNADVMYISPSSLTGVKNGTSETFPLAPSIQHAAAFYGLAKAAGDTTQASSDNAVGTYTSSAKSAIQTMLGIPEALGGYVVSISETAPVITAVANTRYQCGELTSLTFTPPSTGIVDIVFTSGSTATTLTLPNTVKMPSWFNGTLNVNTVYEINIMDGIYGTIMSWT